MESLYSACDHRAVLYFSFVYSLQEGFSSSATCLSGVTIKQTAALTCHGKVFDWIALVQSEDGDDADLVC